MTRAMVLWLLGAIALAVTATPGLGAVALLLAVFAVLAGAWWIALGAGKPGKRTEALVRTRHHEFLGPGGPDDPFSDEPVAAGAEDRGTERYQYLAREAKRLGFELTPTSSLPREATPLSGKSEKSRHVDYARESQP